MKKLLPLILLLTLASTGFAWPFGKRAPMPSPTPAQVETAKPAKPPTVGDGRDLVKQLQVALKEGQEANKKLGEALERAKKELETARGETLVVQKKADDLQAWGVVQQAEKEKYVKKYNDTVAKYHRLKMIAALIAAAVGVLIGLQFMNLAPPPYNFAVPVGAAALFAGLVWMFL